MDTTVKPIGDPIQVAQNVKARSEGFDDADFVPTLSDKIELSPSYRKTKDILDKSSVVASDIMHLPMFIMGCAADLVDMFVEAVGNSLINLFSKDD